MRAIFAGPRLPHSKILFRLSGIVFRSRSYLAEEGPEATKLKILIMAVLQRSAAEPEERAEARGSDQRRP